MHVYGAVSEISRLLVLPAPEKRRENYMEGVGIGVSKHLEVLLLGAGSLCHKDNRLGIPLVMESATSGSELLSPKPSALNPKP